MDGKHLVPPNTDIREFWASLTAREHEPEMEELVQPGSIILVVFTYGSTREKVTQRLNSIVVLEAATPIEFDSD